MFCYLLVNNSKPFQRMNISLLRNSALYSLKKNSISKTIMRLVKKVKLHYRLPKFHNDGTRISGKKIKKVKNFFISNYGRLSVDSSSEGYWEDEGFVFKDVNLEYSIFIPKRKFETKVKKQIPKHIVLSKK